MMCSWRINMSKKTTPLQKFVEINPESISKSYAENEIEYIDISSVGTGQLIESPKLLQLSEAPSRAKRKVKDGDTILSMVRPNLRSFLFLKDPKNNLIVSTGFAVLRSKNNTEPRFIYYAVTDQKFTNYLANNAKGTSYPAVDAETVLRGEILDCGLSEQRKIASILSAYDDLIENNRRRIQLLEQSARLLYKEWFVHFRFPGHEHVKIKNGVPEGWEKGVVRDFYDTTSGGTPNRKNQEFYGGDIKWVKTQELLDCFLFDTEEHITENAIKMSSAKLLPANTVLIAMYGATIGQVGVIVDESTCNQACCAVMPKFKGTSYEHAFMFFLSNKEGLRNLGQGAAQRNISQQVIREYEMVLPDEVILEMFRNHVGPFLAKIKNLQAMNRQLIKARDLLLPKLMNGELVV